MGFSLVHKAMTVVGVCVAAGAASVVASPVATADSGIRWVHEDDSYTDQDCAGQWLSGPNDVRVKDGDLQDDDYCYVEYSLHYKDGEPVDPERFDIPQDWDSYWYHDHVENPTAEKWIWFKVCQERQDDPDLCTKWGQYET